MTATDGVVVGLDRDQLARRVAQDIDDGSYVNLGIGMPEKVAHHIPAQVDVVFHTENGLLGMGPSPETGEGHPELINAGKREVTALPGASYFHHADSFAMIRGGHLDLCVLGALEVAANGDLANWSTGAPDAIPAVGGAMDLVSGVQEVFVMTSHCTRDGKPKLVEECSYPLTGTKVVTRIYTNLAVIRIGVNGFELLELSPDVELADVRAQTAADLIDLRVGGARG